MILGPAAAEVVSAVKEVAYSLLNYNNFKENGKGCIGHDR